MSAHFYAENIVEEGMMRFVENNFIFMQDNLRSHVTKEVLDYLRFVITPNLNWSSRSKDINSLEHL